MPRPINRSAAGRDAVDRAILRLRVHIPNNTTVFGRVGAKMAVEPAGEYDARDCCNSGRLCGVGTSLQPGCGVCQISSPVSRSSACRPPPTLLSNRSAIDGLTGEICAPGTLGATTSNLTSDTAM